MEKIDHSEQILKYLKILNPKNKKLTIESYKAWQKAFEENDQERCAEFVMLSYLDACNQIADWYIADNRNVEDFKDATQDAFFFTSTLTPKTRHLASFRQEVAFFLKIRLDRIEERKLKHNLYLNKDWSPDVDAQANTEEISLDEELAKQDTVKRVIKQYTLLKYPRKKEFLLRACGIGGKQEGIKEIANAENMTVSGVHDQVSKTIKALRKRSVIQDIAKDYN